ncbi:RNI-like protein [Xylariaceae sp. FL1272]|nr:RNI-like protein [Xylariaceae sp. FL1272]
MEQVLDVSWMNHGKDQLGKNGTPSTATAQNNHEPSNTANTTQQATTKHTSKTTISPAQSATAPTSSPAPANTSSPTPAKQIPQRTGRNRSASTDSNGSLTGTPPQRRPSWFSNISSKFSSSPTIHAQSQAAAPTLTSEPDTIGDDVTPLPKITPNKNAVLAHATRQSGDAPYIPAPPRSAQPGFLGVFRRLSSSNGAISPGSRASHGLVERKVLNVDKKRDRSRLDELHQAKLRRVAFCVDVEIAPMPKYTDDDPSPKTSAEKVERKKAVEKKEGLSLEEPKPIDQSAERNAVAKPPADVSPKEPLKEASGNTNGQKEESSSEPTKEQKPEKEMTRKKEKKKKSEAERKAKKEQKRKEALEKGAIPMEIHLDSDSSTEDVSIPKSPRTQFTPTTNPGRIYRRCCQLRETDILTKITAQLPKTTSGCTDGLVEKLDLTGYFMSLADLMTLGDFLAVVPIREVVLENCELTDEGLRVVLAGLLAARKPNVKHRRPITKPADLAPQGGVVERLVLKNNKIGADGWKHICLFLHMCRSIKCLDLSSLPLPPVVEVPKSNVAHHNMAFHFHPPGNQHAPGPFDAASLLSKSLESRLAGAELELLNMGATGLSSKQLGIVIDGILKSGVSRLGLSHNSLDADGVQHVARYLREAKCEGIDLGGNDLKDHLATLAEAIDEKGQLWALSIANCNLDPSSLCKLLPKLTKLTNFKFIDLSHNQALFETQPSAIAALRRYLPKLDYLKRLHLADVSLSSEQAIALAEILPEAKSLAHINILENPELVRLADARTEDLQEEGCALYASLLAAVRVSKTLVKIDVDNPSPESGELLNAIANRVVAYTMRNLQAIPDIRDSSAEDSAPKLEKYPDVLRHLVGHEEDYPIEGDDDADMAPDEDYVIGGTAVVKALACVLKNQGDDSRRPSGEFLRDPADGAMSPTSPRPRIHSAKAKDMSKHLLATARKIRARLQPSLASAKASASDDVGNYHRLIFLDQTIEGIIKRFEDEFPDTRQTESSAAQESDRISPKMPDIDTSGSRHEVENPALSDTEDLETELRSPSGSRSNSIISHTSKAFTEDEAQALRIGHKFRRSFMSAEQFNALNSGEEIGDNPRHVQLVTGLMEEIMDDHEDIRKRVEEKGAVKAFEEDKDRIWKQLRDRDPAYWDIFIDSQQKARANIKVDPNSTKIHHATEHTIDDEEAIAD